DQGGHVLAAAGVASGVDLEQLAAQHVANKLVDAALPDQRAPASRHALDLHRIVGTGADVGEHQTGHACRLAGAQRQGRTAAQRKADDRRTFYVESVEHADEIARQMRGGIIRGGLRRIGLAMTAQIVSDGAETVAQRPDLVEPHALAAGETMQQQHRRAVAGIGYGNAEIADLDFAHRANLIVIPAKAGIHNHRDRVLFTAPGLWVPAFRLRAARFGGLNPAVARRASVGGSRGRRSTRSYAATVPKNSSNSLRSLAVAVSTSSVAASMVSAELRVWVTPLATSSSAAEIALAPAAALATLWEISPVAASCCSTEPATAEVYRL